MLREVSLSLRPINPSREVPSEVRETFVRHDNWKMCTFLLWTSPIKRTVTSVSRSYGHYPLLRDSKDCGSDSQLVVSEESLFLYLPVTSSQSKRNERWTRVRSNFFPPLNRKWRELHSTVEKLLERLAPIKNDGELSCPIIPFLSNKCSEGVTFSKTGGRDCYVKRSLTHRV